MSSQRNCLRKKPKHEVKINNLRPLTLLNHNVNNKANNGSQPKENPF